LTRQTRTIQSGIVAKRISLLRKKFAAENVDGLLVTRPENIRYLCGYTGSNGALLITRRAAWLYTDFRYAEQVKTEVRDCRPVVLKRWLYMDLPLEHVRGVRRLGVEAGHMTLQIAGVLRKRLKGTRLVPVRREQVLELRRRKEPAEVRAIARAQRVTERAFAEVLKLVRPGVTERELAAEITCRFNRVGDNAFPPIVASGPNGAKPHAEPTGRKLRKGDAITFDIGCRVDGYCSDMTRTVFLGRPNPDLEQVYRIVHEAQRRGLRAVRPGAECSAVDRVARDYIADQGYGPQFGHGLGHGVGLAVHELPGLAGPIVGTLEPGDVVTVEPGIYLPGLGGVRIEDMVLVTKTGSRNLTRAPKHLTKL
jgi:Xaa-Pro aminopeptidase